MASAAGVAGVLDRAQFSFVLGREGGTKEWWPETLLKSSPNSRNPAEKRMIIAKAAPKMSELPEKRSRSFIRLLLSFSRFTFPLLGVF